MVRRFIRQAPGFLQPSPVMDVTAARTNQRLGAAWSLAGIFGSMHRLSTRSLPPFAIVDPHCRRDLAGAHAIVSFCSGHGATIHQASSFGSGCISGVRQIEIHVEQHLAVTVAAMPPEKRQRAVNVDPVELGQHGFRIAVL